MTLQNKLKAIAQLAQEELGCGLVRQREQYDASVKPRELVVGQKALLLLLLMTWQGPYEVVEKAGAGCQLQDKYPG